MSNDKSLENISNKLDTIIKLLAINIVRGRELKEQVRLLSQVNLSPKEIAEILGKTPNTIRVTLFGLRKESKKGGRIE